MVLAFLGSTGPSSRDKREERANAPDSWGQPTGGSTLALVDRKLPVTNTRFISGPNALRLAWTSAKNGNWSTEIGSYRWRNRPARWAGATLYLWAWSDAGIATADLPQVALIDSVKADLAKSPTAPLPLSDFPGAIPARRWVRIAIPLDRFAPSSIHGCYER